MLFKKTDELRPGMRLARPIYNRDGVLLYERDSKITKQGIDSVKNFGLIGIYILEPAEPVPPMTKADIEFERFQTMSIFSIKEELNKLIQNKRAEKLPTIVTNIVKNYGGLKQKINFIQNLRSKEDYIYKHTLNVAMLCAMIGNKMGLKAEVKTSIVMAALLHDIGRLMGTLQESDEKALEQKGIRLVETFFAGQPIVKRICRQLPALMDNPRKVLREAEENRLHVGTRVLQVAETFDRMTAMQLDKKPESEVYTIKYLLENDNIYDQKIVAALIKSINILAPGVSIELNNKKKGIVLIENGEDILRPVVLEYGNNTMIDLSRPAYRDIMITDIMKTMDNRHVMDIETLRQKGYEAKTEEFVPV